MMKSLRMMIGLLCPLFLMCGIFSPRDITTQPAVNESEDPFMFRKLLEGTSEMFSKYTWQDFFNPDCEYTNVTLSGTVNCTRETLVNHLLQLFDLYPDVTVNWQRTVDVVRDVDRIQVNQVSYTVNSSHFTDPPLYSGSSDFVLVRDASSVWRIQQWKDYSDQSFFSPAK